MNNTKNRVLAAALLTMLDPVHGTGCVFLQSETEKEAVAFLKNHFKDMNCIEKWVKYWSDRREEGGRCFYWVGDFKNSQDSESALKWFKGLVDEAVPEKKEPKPIKETQDNSKSTPSKPVDRLDGTFPMGGLLDPDQSVPQLRLADWFSSGAQPRFGLMGTPFDPYYTPLAYATQYIPSPADIEAARMRHAAHLRFMNANSSQLRTQNPESAPGDAVQ